MLQLHPKTLRALRSRASRVPELGCQTHQEGVVGSHGAPKAHEGRALPFLIEIGRKLCFDLRSQRSYGTLTPHFIVGAGGAQET